MDELSNGNWRFDEYFLSSSSSKLFVFVLSRIMSEEF